MCYHISVTTVLSTLIRLLQKGEPMFSIDLMSRVPIYEQICEKIIEFIINGTLTEHEQLPSVRNLAKSTGVNPNTVAKAYQELERKGIIYFVLGRGSFIAELDKSELNNTALADFDLSVKKALEKGISADLLKNRIDFIKGGTKKGERHDRT